MKKFIGLVIILLLITLITNAQSYVKVADRDMYQEYLNYCNKKVLDTVMMVGYKKLPLVRVTYVNNYTFRCVNGTWVRKKGVYLTQDFMFSSSRYRNQDRKRTYKNVSKTQPPVPKLTSTKIAFWLPVVYYCYQRKPSIRDFYEWYYPLSAKPK